jgi:PEP-CTERM motif
MRVLFVIAMCMMLICGCGNGGGSDVMSFGSNLSGGGGTGGGIPPAAHAPEPMTIGLFGIGLAGLFAAGKKKKEKT